MNRKRGIGGGSFVGSMDPASNPAGGSVNNSGINVAVTGAGNLGGSLSDVATGRVSLVMLGGLVLVIILFYGWTHKAQGGG